MTTWNSLITLSYSDIPEAQNTHTQSACSYTVSINIKVAGNEIKLKNSRRWFWAGSQGAN